MTGLADNHDRDDGGLYGPSESDIERYGDEDYETRVARRNRLPGLAWKAAAGIAFIALSVSLVLNVILPGLSHSRAQSKLKTVDALVTSVIDARTIGVEIDGVQSSVRYIGVLPPGPGEPYHETALAANEQWMLNRTVTLEADRTDTDPDGRLLRYVWVDGTMMNETLLGVGLARLDDVGDNDRYLDSLTHAQSNARAAGLGIWSPVVVGSGRSPEGAAPGI